MTILASPLLSGRNKVMLINAAAIRATHFIAVTPMRLAEQVKSSMIRHLEDFSLRHRASFSGKKEMLRHR
jgi:hypothetical protein